MMVHRHGVFLANPFPYPRSYGALAVGAVGEFSVSIIREESTVL